MASISKLEQKKDLARKRATSLCFLDSRAAESPLAHSKKVEEEGGETIANDRLMFQPTHSTTTPPSSNEVAQATAVPQLAEVIARCNELERIKDEKLRLYVSAAQGQVQRDQRMVLKIEYESVMRELDRQRNLAARLIKLETERQFNKLKMAELEKEEMAAVARKDQHLAEVSAANSKPASIAVVTGRSGRVHGISSVATEFAEESSRSATSGGTTGFRSGRENAVLNGCVPMKHAHIHTPCYHISLMASDEAAGWPALPTELIQSILLCVHPNDIPELASVNRYLRRTISACVDHSFADQHLKLLTKGGRNLKQSAGILRRIQFDHPVLFQYAVALLVQLQVSGWAADMLWSKRWRNAAADSRGARLRSSRARVMMAALGKVELPASEIPRMFKAAVYLRSMELLDFLRRTYLSNSLEDLETSPMRAYLFLSAEIGFIDGLALIPNGHSVLDACDEKKPHRTLLYVAAIHSGSTAAVQMLIDKGASVNGNRDHIPSLDGSVEMDPLASLHHVALAASSDMLCLLLKHGVDVEAKDSLQYTPLAWAVERGRPDVMQILLDHGADPHTRNWEKNTPLHLAAACGRSQMLRTLFPAGAELNARNSGDRMPLHLACARGQIDCVRALLELGATVKSGHENDIEMLYSLCVEGHIEAARLLIEHGAAIADRGAYLLQAASSSGSSEMVQLVLEAMPGQRPLHMLAEELYWGRLMENVLVGMVEAGAKLDERDEEGRTLLHVAATRKNTGLMLWLLRKRVADLTALDKNGNTWLDVARANGLKGWLAAQSAELAACGVWY
ncbi:hypothetical protein HDU96_007096 [Phlyctochytrium bullatum]|nr:hypothetical protein HDU96_007096 [Phlyctochytrium bullatum]